MAKNNKTRFFYVLYSDKTRVFDQSERACYSIYIIIVNKPLSAAGISEDNAQGRKIVRKMNSWPRSKASRATVKF